MTSAARYLRPDVIAQVERLDLKARFIVEGFVSGLHGSPYHGFSAEFSEHRRYVHGDDIRLIDWRVYARTDRLYIRKFDAETNLECHLLVDASASMAYPEAGQAGEVRSHDEPGVGRRRSRLPQAPPRMSKFEYAICLAAALGYMMIGQQDAVGLTWFDSQVRCFLPARSKRSHLMRIISELAAVRPVADEAGKGLASALHDVARRIHKRGLIIVLSDFLTDVDEVIRALHHLRFRGHDLILFQVLDWSEVAFPFDRLSAFEDPETGRTLVTQPEAIREQYLQALHDFTQRYRTEAGALRADFVQVNTSMTFDRALIQFLIDRQHRF